MNFGGTNVVRGGACLPSGVAGVVAVISCLHCSLPSKTIAPCFAPLGIVGFAVERENEPRNSGEESTAGMRRFAGWIHAR